MQNIQRLIETLLDETGIPATLVVEPGKDGGWRAAVVEDGETLLCPAGERFLVATDDDDMYAAIELLEQKVADGFAQYERERA